MRRWTTYLWRALAVLADSGYPSGFHFLDAPPYPRAFAVDLSDDSSVRAAFCSIVEWEWGAAALGSAHPQHRPDDPAST